MNDLFDDARSVLDAAMKEIERLTHGEDVCATARDANVLGVHLTAVMMAFAARRHKATAGLIHDGGLHQVLAGAVATVISNAAMGFRPVDNGRPIPPAANALFLLSLIAEETMKAVSIHENGLQDFVIPFRSKDGGGLEPTPFDVRELLKGKT